MGIKISVELTANQWNLVTSSLLMLHDELDFRNKETARQLVDCVRQSVRLQIDSQLRSICQEAGISEGQK